MAEIHVERKRRISPLLWIFLIAILAVIAAWVAWTMFVGTEPEPAGVQTTTEVRLSVAPEANLPPAA